VLEPTEENTTLLNNNKPKMSGGGYQANDTQGQVDEVMGIMKNNIDKVLERDTKIQNLNERSDALQVGAHKFLQTGTQLKRKMWWKNAKFMIVIAVVGVIIVGIVIGIIVAQSKKKKT